MFSIGFSTGRASLISWAIRKMTGSKVSHAFLLFDDVTLGDRFLMEADRGGFQTQRLKLFLKSNVLVVEVPVDISVESVRAADRWIGEGYDYLGLVGEAIVKIAAWFGRKIESPLADPRSMFCSEAMVRLLQEAQYPGAAGLIGRDTSPQDLLSFLLKDRPDLRAKLAGLQI